MSHRFTRIAFHLATGIFMLQALYTFIVSPQADAHLPYLQTGLLFAILGTLLNLRATNAGAGREL